MARKQQSDEFTLVYDALMPALSRAAVGDYAGEVELMPERSRRVNELLMGVEVLLEVLRETATTKPNSGEQAKTEVHLLDEVLNRPTN